MLWVLKIDVGGLKNERFAVKAKLCTLQIGLMEFGGKGERYENRLDSPYSV
jgi:hypothetical protein